MSVDIDSFEEFWPFYVRQHSLALNRYLHLVGTGIVLFLLLYASISRRWVVILILPLLGYGPAWAGHYIIEKNRPATFKYPLWSLMADFKMFYYYATFRPQKVTKHLS